MNFWHILLKQPAGLQSNNKYFSYLLKFFKNVFWGPIFPVVRMENNGAPTCLGHYKNNNYVILF